MATIFKVDLNDPVPLYAQLERAIRFAIATGSLRAGQQLPTVRQLAVDLRINANTVAKVYAELERNGVVETRRGAGTFVRAAHIERGLPPERKRQLRQLARRFLHDAAMLGYGSGEALDFLAQEISKEIVNHGRHESDEN